MHVQGQRILSYVREDGAVSLFPDLFTLASTWIHRHTQKRNSDLPSGKEKQPTLSHDLADGACYHHCIPSLSKGAQQQPGASKLQPNRSAALAAGQGLSMTSLIPGPGHTDLWKCVNEDVPVLGCSETSGQSRDRDFVCGVSLWPLPPLRSKTLPLSPPGLQKQFQAHYHSSFLQSLRGKHNVTASHKRWTLSAKRTAWSPRRRGSNQSIRL